MTDPSDVPIWKVENDYSLYQPLDYNTKKEIRLVTIAPGSSNDPIICHLSDNSLLNTGIRFEALSYCWGALDDTTTIILHHENSSSRADNSPVAGGTVTKEPLEQTFNITKNLDMALRHMRREGEARVMWIDALCINQGSIKERNYTIPFMVDVYKLADRVIIFLGEEGKTQQFKAFWDILDMMERASQKSFGVPLGQRKDVDALINSIKIVPNENAGPTAKDTSLFEVHLRLAFSTFFKYHWFQRVWVIQEAMNAKEAVVQCGERQRVWPDILVMLHWAAKSSQSYVGGLSGRFPQDMLPPFLWTKLNAARGGKVDGPAHMPLIDLIAGGRAFYATDPRDKLFALLSFGEETHNIEQLSPRLKPDYGKSISMTWVDLTRQWIIDHRSLDILAILGEKVDKNNQVARKTWFISGKSDKGFDINHAVESPPDKHPSWALWHAEHPEAALRALFRMGEGIQQSSFEFNVGLIDQAPDPFVLSLQGIVLDRITKVHWPFRRWTHRDGGMRVFNFRTSPPKMVKSGVAAVWATTIGVLPDLDTAVDNQVRPVANTSLNITPYPNNTARIQAYIETLTCRPLSRVYFAPNDSLMDLDVKEGETELEPKRRADLITIAHFAAHWLSSIDREMKWIPGLWAEQLMRLAKHGSSEEFTTLCEYAEDRCFFQTEKGIYGLCPRGTQAGDVVASLAGGKTPFVLHLSQDEREEARFSLLGECYYHGPDIRRTTAAMAEKKTEVNTFHII